MSTIDDITSFIHTVDTNEKEFYCYLAVNFRHRQKTNTRIDVSVNPIDSLNILNAKLQHPIWRLELVIGSFRTAQGADIFRNTWEKKSRGIRSRKIRGMNLSVDFNKKLEKFSSKPVNWRDYLLTCWDYELNPKHKNSPKIDENF